MRTYVSNTVIKIFVSLLGFGGNTIFAMKHTPQEQSYYSMAYLELQSNQYVKPIGQNSEFSSNYKHKNIFLDPSYVDNVVQISSSIRSSSISQFSTLPDPFLVELRELQCEGNKTELEKISLNFKKALSKAWFGRKAIQTQIDKVEKILNARITELLSIVRNGTKQQALEAIKEIRRLSPYSYILHENMPQQLSESHQKRLDQHIKQSGFNYFIAAEIIFQKRYSGIQTSVQPNDKQGTYFFEGQPLKQPVSGKQEIKDPSLIVPIIPQEVGYDLALTTPTQLNLFYQYVTVDPKADFPGYIQQVKSAIADLKHKGLYTAETVVLFTKEFIEGTLAHGGHVVQHPIQYGKDFVEGNVEILKKVGNLFVDIATLSDDELKQSMHERVEVITQWYNQMSQTVPHMSRTDWANITSRLFTDYLVFKGVAKGVSVAKSIPEAVKQNEFLGTVQANLEQAILKHPEMVTPEGIVVKAFQVFEEKNILKNTVEKLNSDPSILNNFGLGSTGRTIAKNLTEKLAMEEIMSNPSMGIIVTEGLKDQRWKGWSKMSNRTAHGIEIHYVGKWENNVLVAVDDFKFIGD